MPQRPSLPWLLRPPPEEPATSIRPLVPADVPALRLPWSSRFNPASLAAHVTRYPDQAWVHPDSGDYLVAEPWRRRDEIAGVVEIHARRARGALLDRAAADLGAAGQRVLLLPEGEAAGPGRVAAAHGFQRLERVVYFQLQGLGGMPVVTRPLPPLDFTPLTDRTLETVLAVDHASFPWLWWNSAAEFQAYRHLAGVQVWIGWAAGVAVAYAGTTQLDRWGHLDRLGVDPAWHGRGYGAAMLAFALGRLGALGVTRVTLSTQETNTQSQRLYTGFGFRQTTEVYDIYGRWLDGDGVGGAPGAGTGR